MIIYAQNEAAPTQRVLPFFLVDEITGDPTAIAIVNTNVQLHKFGGTWVDATNNPVALIGQDGAWELQLEQAEVDTLGPFGWRVIATGVRFQCSWEQVGPGYQGNTLLASIISTLSTISTLISGVPSAVWEELAASHTTPGTYGELLQSPVAAIVSDLSNSQVTFKTNLTETSNNYYKDSLCCFLDGPLKEQVHKVTGYNGSTKFITVTIPYSAAPSAGNRFVLVTK